ncbi:FkbM family methyltransferase [Phenylobacterium soli]|uniref:FkbM family methyltransferase n=1 Tax=Phenylobacterium soli TaxID=2170551 RepID=A0A328AIF5_9CAUL|nr:FkbM family methyltransferase [Phenylobacterium soli]RAK54703.1 FkbM family methyltransferase [Phenylobacterium soli]
MSGADQDEGGAIRELTIHLGDRSVVMAYRDGTKDRYTLEETWTKHPYRLSRHPVARREAIDATYGRLVAAGKTPLILDAGANIGASAVFFAWRYPEARIVAVEPEPGNFALLERNVRPYPQVRCVQAAVAATDGEVQLFDPGRSTDAYRAVSADPGGEHGAALGAVRACSVSTLLREHGEGAAPLLAKIDIEGAETELFAGDTAWVDLFPAIAIELHDWMLPGKASSAAFLKCVAERGRDFLNPAATDIVFSLRNPD